MRSGESVFRARREYRIMCVSSFGELREDTFGPAPVGAGRGWSESNILK